MMTLYKYQIDNRDSESSKNIYADTIDNSVKKWIDLIKDSENCGRDEIELKSILNEGKRSTIQRLDGTKNTYYLTLVTNQRQRTIYINEFETQPDFIADLKYLSAEEGGRKECAISGYRPHVKFPFSDNPTTGEQIFWDKDKVLPGESVRAQIRILDHVTFKNSLSRGTTFEFREGPHLIGTGEIVEVINVVLKKASR